MFARLFFSAIFIFKYYLLPIVSYPVKRFSKYYQELAVFVLASLLQIITADAQTKNPDSTSAKSLVFKKADEPLLIFMPEYDRTTSRLVNAFNVMQKANAGDAIAQHELGLRYLTGEGFPADTMKAVVWIQKAALQDLPPARYNYGIMLNNGWGTAWDPFEAFRQFRSAASTGMKEAEFVYGLLLTDNLVVSKNYQEAYRWLDKAARHDFDPAEEAIEEFRRRKLFTDDMPTDADSLDQTQKPAGHTPNKKDKPTDQSKENKKHNESHLPEIDKELLEQDALEQLKHSDDVAQDVTTEDSLTLQSVYAAAQAGSPEAMVLLGFWNQHGNLGSVNEMAASVYYLRALRLESPWAPLLLEELVTSEGYYDRLKSRVASHDPAAEFVWAGLVTYHFDNSITENQAFEFLQNAASYNYMPALLELGMCYFNGHWVKQDRIAAQGIFKTAVTAGSDEANIRLAMLAIADSMAAGKDSLVTIFQNAATNGSVLAQAMLGYCYAKGIGVSFNKSQALWYYRRAASRGSSSAYRALRALYDEVRPNELEFHIADEDH